MIRIIPRLDIKGPDLVKGVHLEGLRVLGKPADFVRYYYEHGADELIYIDTVASLYGRNNLLHIVREAARNVFVPLTVAGGLRTLDDMRSALHAGADKVALNTAAVRNPGLVTEAARRFGSSAIVGSIEAKKQPDGTYEPYTDNGRERTFLNAIDWAVHLAEAGAGEILLMSIDRDGTGTGFDLDLVRRVATAVPIPVIASGGAGTLQDIAAVILTGKADAVALASVFHYECAQHLSGDHGSLSGNVEFLKSRRDFTRVSTLTLEQTKAYLASAGVSCRIEGTARCA